MVLEIILTILVVLGASGYYYLYYKPKKAHRTLANTLRQLGYKVYVYPYQFMGIPRIKQMRDNTAQHKDSRYAEKHLLPGYDVAVTNLLASPYLVLLHHSLIKHSLTPDMMGIMHKHASFGKVIQAIMPTGLVFSEGEEWRHSRKLLSKVFNYDFITNQIPLIRRFCDQVLDQHEEQSVKNGTTVGKTHQINMLKAMTDIFSAVVLSSFLGMEASEETINDKPIHNAVNQLFYDAFLLLKKQTTVLIAGPKLLKLALVESHREFNRKEQNIRNFIRRKIQKLSNQTSATHSKASSILEAIIADSKLEGQSIYSEQKMIDQVITFIFAGSDTTSNMINFAVRAVYESPSVLHKAQKEVNQVIKSDEDITQENLKKLNYLEAIQFETNRMFGPLNGLVTRTPNKDTFIDNIPVFKGLLIGCDFKPMFYDPNIYEDPHTFKPQRWLNCPPQMVGAAGMAFGGGSRACIGRHLALLEGKIALVKLLQRYKSLEQTQERVIEFTGVDSIKHNEVRVTIF